MMVNVVTSNLKGEAVEWMTNLHDEGPELLNADLFMEQLRVRFEDESQALRVEKEIHRLRERGCPVKKYVQEFWRVTSCLGKWSEWSLIHYFK